MSVSCGLYRDRYVSRAWGLPRTFWPCRGIGTAFVCVAALLLLAGTAGAVGPAKKQEGRSFFDVRLEPAELAQEARTTASMRAAQAGLLDSLGFHGVVDVDRLTGTPRVVARLDGFLTGPMEGGAEEVALGYVREHADAFGLDAGDIAALRLTRAYTDIGGTTHLRWVQTYDGIPALDNGLSASVTKDGRLVNVLGSPRRDLRLADVAPGLSAAAALGYSLHDAGAKLAPPRVLGRAAAPTRDTRFAGGHRAGLVLFTGPRGVRLAWRVLAHAKPTQVFDYVVDAETGEVLRRSNLVDFAQARVFDYYPGAANGGAAVLKSLDSWLAPGATTLTGPNAHAYLDVELGRRRRRGGAQLDAPGPAHLGLSADGVLVPGRATARRARTTVPGTTPSPVAGARTRIRAPPSSSTTSTRSTTISRPARSGSPPQPGTSRQPTPSWPRPTTAPAGPGVFRTGVTGTTRTCSRRRTGSRPACRCTSSHAVRSPP